MNKENYPKILFVDDEKYILNSIRRLFFKKPYKIYTADSAQTGLELLNVENVDVVVSDVKMPKMDGIEFLTEVKRLYPGINRIILSGHIEKQYVINAILTGISFTYINKPWDNEELFQKLQYVLNVTKVVESKNVLRKVSGIRKLPNIPEVYYEFLDSINNNQTMNRIARIISKDISLTTKMIQIVNSAFYPKLRVASLEKAMEMLGLNNVRSIIILTTLIDTKDLKFKERSELIKISTQACQVNKVLQKFYRLKYGCDIKNDYKSLGLIYEIGKLIVLRDFSETYFKITDELWNENSIDFYGKEMEFGHYGCTYREIGAYFLHLWNFPEISIAAALYNFDLENLNQEEKEVIELLQLADKYVKYEAIGLLEKFYKLSVLTKLNFSKGKIKKLFL